MEFKGTHVDSRFLSSHPFAHRDMEHKNVVDSKKWETINLARAYGWRRTLSTLSNYKTSFFDVQKNRCMFCWFVLFDIYNNLLCVLCVRIVKDANGIDKKLPSTSVSIKNKLQHVTTIDHASSFTIVASPDIEVNKSTSAFATTKSWSSQQEESLNNKLVN